MLHNNLWWFLQNLWDIKIIITHTEIFSLYYTTYSKTITVLTPETRKNLYTSIIRSTLLYCSCLYKPILIERVHKQAPNYILCDYNNGYKLRPMRLNPSFTSGPTRWAGSKLKHKTASSYLQTVWWTLIFIIYPDCGTAYQ